MLSLLLHVVLALPRSLLAGLVFPFTPLKALREALTRSLLLYLLKMADNHLG